MSAACWYVRTIPRKAFSTFARRRGAGMQNPVVLVCECGAVTTFEVVAAIGVECERCREPLMPEEQLDAACSAATLGAPPDAIFKDLLRISEAPEPDADHTATAPVDRPSDQVLAVMAAFNAVKKEG